MQHSITAQYLARYHRIAEADAEADTGAVGGSAGLLPVTGAQRRFILVRSLDPQGRPDVVPLFFAFPRSTVDLPRLSAAAGYLAALHPALRARAEVVRGTPVQRLAAPEVPVRRVPLRPGENAAAALRRTLRGWQAQGSPLRLFLADGGPADGSGDGAGDGSGTEEEVLAVALDHAACDGQSLARITEELGAAYADGLGPADVPRSRAEEGIAAYREAVLLQLAAEDRASSAQALAHWGGRLRAVRSAAVARTSGTGALPAPTALPTGAAELRLTSGDRQVPFPALLGACTAAAHALYGHEGVSPLGYPWGGRPAAAPDVLGCFLNTVVFPAATGPADAGPTSISADSTSPAANGLDALSAAWWDDLDRADTPFDEVVHAARAAGAAWSGGLDGLLTVEDARRRPPLRLGTRTGREVHVDGRPVRAPFAVSVTHGTDLLVRMVWDRAFLDDAAATDAFAELTGVLRDQLSPTQASTGQPPTPAPN
ncbi:non-ribosomal peptide synthetase [Streptomyces iconiensis]|uniref:Non-ribosomal peptide synthetase n=1 Tax=Streptomyces iconiensis TaxID=1384038 RepID=A0ABT7A7F3_9ACTN|nr:non-ribosomal peptide synthetase [Streptomyces iconiensis]MDJ1137007.1 non-ribosomal peptide synthetase [Streptomyces iconiensis]